ncbi:CHAP domain-containing protein [Brevibacterium oceani]|uniref:CHAP domain-containing protein n=1 Tax=Brevibacterium oceani TaxID=358099 RepID=UPI0015E74D13|nr:CHAP domain-containing protein [Brevibacterium oceani]
MIAISKRAVIGILLVLALVVGMAGLSVAEATVSASPAAAKSTKAPMSQKSWPCYQKKNQVCVKQFGYKKSTTAWGYPKDRYGNNCTKYVAFRLSKMKMKNPGNMGDAYKWDSNAKKYGLKVTKTPAVGDVAQWNTSSRSPRGHVAYVDWVSSDKKTIYVSSTSYDDSGVHSYSGRAVLKKGKTMKGYSEITWPSNFITFKKASTNKPAPKAVTAKVMAKTQKMSKATLKSTQKGWYAKGSKLTLKCYVRGQKVKGYYSKSFKGGWDDLWYKVSDGYYESPRG